jgi:hypothetical protein
MSIPLRAALQAANLAYITQIQSVKAAQNAR